ncbi:GNAT family N-acetyltransferase [Flammeovirga yaeyamensis]|uniref:GNAT family N-acetyltransferase n=1 Tax=Flammeovirga yaeyamensis TaxID=367791 RepID=A0AAX1N5E7_9BACT|nr:GNAT family N-acetyltransferase [Flammeovirga yaeyamensis]MBB3698224.1 RimJ/RimL family protein N-acetyltransferase [Flammeovirga yaeyamensis]NMF34421.1 acetyltransferase [Flammeovirga yaeyamensis]QWG01400.1 GNAT family N-acetyltransferase [Flammeovirga yaeyamensis]
MIVIETKVPIVEWEELASNYSKTIESYGTFRLRPFSFETDLEQLHEWVNLPYAKYWQLENSTLEVVRSTYQEIIDGGSTTVLMGEFNGKTVFLMELYYVPEDRVSEHFSPDINDYGFHILVGPSDNPVKGFTANIFSFIMEFMFSNKKVQRIVVEPDIENEKIHVLNKKAGFRYQNIINFPEKQAYLAFCTRNDFHLSEVYQLTN